MASVSLAAYIELGKLRLSALAILAVLAGLCMGCPELPTWWLALATMSGTALVAIGGNAMNMYLERDTDAFMDRTRSRPLVSGRLLPRQVLAFGLGATALGLVVLATLTNAYATSLCASIFAIYVLVYTPLKRRTTLNTLVGAVPGALPPVVGYAAGAGRLDSYALLLFLIVYFWQIPHFLAIAWRYRDQYRRAGLVMLPVTAPTGTSTALYMVTYCLGLVAISIFPALPSIGMNGPLYLGAALALGTVFLASTVLAAVFRRSTTMRQCFIVSIIYLPLLLGAMVVDKYLVAA